MAYCRDASIADLSAAFSDLVRTIRLPLLPVLLLLQLPLILNRGYFSHDDLEWLARADVAGWHDVPWIPWFANQLQYRPLTFNAWLAIAHAVGHSPLSMHLVDALLGAFNGWLLARILTTLATSCRIAYAAAVVFVLSPAAIYVHGWTGALGDTLTLTFGLAATCALCASDAAQGARGALHAAGGFACLALALMCKESAIVLPPLVLLTLLYRRQARHSRDATAAPSNSMPPEATNNPDLHDRAPLIAIACAFAAVAAYLAVRWPTLHDSGRFDAAYAWSIANIPARLADYLLYPFTPPLFEVAPLLDKAPSRIAAAAICIAILLGALATAGRRWPAAWIAAFTVALAPVLVLAIAYDHYAYLATAESIAIVGLAWPSMHRRARPIVLALAAIVVVHGAAVTMRVREVGAIQRNLYADLVSQLESSPASVRIVAADPRDAWIPGRLLDGVAVYRGTTFQGRVHLDDALANATTLSMTRDGHLSPVRL